MTKSRGLGRGLSELIGENYIDDDHNKELININIERIEPNPKQPRTIFDPEKLEELKLSILKNGILQPLLLRKTINNQYQIIAGERRWRAAKLAKLKHVPAIIKETDNKETLELALIENIHRSDLNPLEEAETYQRLIEEHFYTQESLSHVVSKSRSHIANLVRILNLPEQVKKYLRESKISLGHAKLLVSYDNALEIADIIIGKKLSVKQTEDLLKANKTGNPPSENNVVSREKNTSNQDIINIAKYLSQSLKAKVDINSKNKNQGKITILYEDLTQLDQIIQKITNAIN